MTALITRIGNIRKITDTAKSTRAGKLSGTRGFTLLELMTVIAIIGILSAMAVPSFQKSIIRAREASLSNSLFVLRDVIDQYYADHGTYPPTLESLVEKNYIRAIPMDPVTGSTDTWILIPPQGEDLSGIYDIHSGSDRVSLYGTPYNEW